MRKWLQFGISFVLGLVVFIAVLAKLGANTAIKALGLFFSLPGLAIIALTGLLVLVSAYKWKIILRYQEERFFVRQLLPFILIGLALGYLTPFSVFGGEIFRVYFLQKKYPRLLPEKAMASVAADRLLEVTAFFIFLISGLLVFGLFGPVLASPLGWAALACAGFFLGLLLIFYFKNWQKKSALEWLMKCFGVKKRLLGENGASVLAAEQEVFRFFSLKNKTLWQGFGLAFLEYLGYFFRAFLLVFFLTGSFPFIKSLAVYGFANLASLTPLPATLGALEISQGFAFSILGFGFNKGVVFSMVWRAADLFFCFLGLLFFIKYTTQAAQEKLLRLFGKR